MSLDSLDFGGASSNVGSSGVPSSGSSAPPNSSSSEPSSASSSQSSSSRQSSSHSSRSSRSSRSSSSSSAGSSGNPIPETIRYDEQANSVTITVRNESEFTSNETCLQAIAAVRTQLSRDFTPVWGISAQIFFTPNPNNPKQRPLPKIGGGPPMEPSSMAPPMGAMSTGMMPPPMMGSEAMMSSEAMMPPKKKKSKAPPMMTMMPSSQTPTPMGKKKTMMSFNPGGPESSFAGPGPGGPGGPGPGPGGPGPGMMMMMMGGPGGPGPGMMMMPNQMKKKMMMMGKKKQQMKMKLRQQVFMKTNTFGLCRIVDPPIDVTNALGYHSSEGELIVGTESHFAWTLSHEILEFLADQRADITVPATLNMESCQVIREVCDPVTVSTYYIGNYPMADFVYPSWFQQDQTMAKQYNHLNTLTAPLTFGGDTTSFISVTRQGHKGWWVYKGGPNFTTVEQMERLWYPTIHVKPPKIIKPPIDTLVKPTINISRNLMDVIKEWKYLKERWYYLRPYPLLRKRMVDLKKEYLRITGIQLEPNFKFWE